MNIQKYTLTLKLYNLQTNDDRIIEIEGLSGSVEDLKIEFMGIQNWTKEDEKAEIKDSEQLEQTYCNDCLLEEQEMLDEVISSQRLEIESLKKIVESQQSYIEMLQTSDHKLSSGLVDITSKLVEILGKK